MDRKIAEAFIRHIDGRSFDFKDDRAASVLEFLYVAYTEIQGRDPVEIDEGFLALDKCLESMTLEENNAIFAVVCDLCDAYEKRAFIDAVQIGAHLMLEL